MGRERLVMDTFVELADTLASDYDIGALLHKLVERCEAILSVAAAGVLVESPDGGLRLVAATSSEMKVLEEVEMRHGGPSVEAYRRGEQVLSRDLRDDEQRWPEAIEQRSTWDCWGRTHSRSGWAMTASAP